jgi:hypothetical protein
MFICRFWWKIKTTSYFLIQSNWDKTLILKLLMKHLDRIPPSWDLVKFHLPHSNSIFRIPDDVIISELIHPPAISRQLAFTILDRYDLPPELHKEIYKIPCEDNDNVLWGKITKVIAKHLNTQDAKLLYVFFSLQRYRLPQESIDLDSMEHLSQFNNYVVACIKKVIDEPSEADKTLKTFLEKSGHGQDYNCYLYHKLSLIYLHMMLPIPLRAVNDVNLESKANTFGRKKLQDEICKVKCEKKLKDLEEKANDPTNLTRRMEFEAEIIKIKGEIENFNPSFDDSELNRLMNKAEDAERKRSILFSGYHFHSENYNRILMMASMECPEYIRQVQDRGFENIGLRISTRQSGLKIPKLCQCQFCYRYRLQDISRKGEYSWSCDDDRPCGKKYDAWNRHLNRLEIQLSKVYGDRS